MGVGRQEAVEDGRLCRGELFHAKKDILLKDLRRVLILIIIIAQMGPS